MRMWCVPAELMCYQHALGEHVELHMFIGTLKKGVDVTGYQRLGLLQISRLVQRHDELVAEFKNRGWPSGFSHATPASLAGLTLPETDGFVLSVDENIAELERRCRPCQLRIRQQVALRLR